MNFMSVRQDPPSGDETVTFGSNRSESRGHAFPFEPKTYVENELSCVFTGDLSFLMPG